MVVRPVVPGCMPIIANFVFAFKGSSLQHIEIAFSWYLDRKLGPPETWNSPESTHTAIYVHHSTECGLRLARANEFAPLRQNGEKGAQDCVAVLGLHPPAHDSKAASRLEQN